MLPYETSQELKFGPVVNPSYITGNWIFFDEYFRHLYWMGVLIHLAPTQRMMIPTRSNGARKILARQENTFKRASEETLTRTHNATRGAAHCAAQDRLDLARDVADGHTLSSHDGLSAPTKMQAHVGSRSHASAQQSVCR